VTTSNFFGSEQSRDEFLAEPRLGILLSNRKEGTPMGVPVWYEWDSKVVLMFAGNYTTKVKRLRRDPKASVLVPNRIDEEERWVAFDGLISISDTGGFELAERLAPKYWDLDDPKRREMLEMWRAGRELMCLLTLEPAKIRTGG